MRDIPDIYYDLIAALEGDRLDAYQDSKGVWTIGRGHTGPEVVEGMTVSEDESKHMCTADSHIALGRLYAAADPILLDKLPDHKFAALLSFVFNLGADPTWMIWHDLQTKTANLFDVPTQMVRFDKVKLPSGSVITVPGLLHRRVAEVTFWNTADVEAAGKVMDAAPVPPPPSSETRTAATPPAPASPAVPAIQSKTRWAGGIIAALGVATALQTALASTQHSIDGAGLSGPWLTSFDHYIGVAIAVMGVAVMIIRSIDEQLKTK